MSATIDFDQSLPVNANTFVSQSRGFLRNAGKRFFDVMAVIGENSQGARKARAFQALSALSDEDLAKRGLTRDGLAGHVFGPFYS